MAENIEKIKENNLLEIEKLTKLRDTLLPRLMSGEIDVSKINCDLKFNIYFKKFLSKITKLLNFMKKCKIIKFLFILLLISIFLSNLSKILTKKSCCFLEGNVNSIFPYIFALIFGRVLPVHIELTHPLYSSDKT